MSLAMLLLGVICHQQVVAVASLHTKFEPPNFNCSKDS